MNQRQEYRAILAADIERSSGRGDTALSEIRQTLHTALRESVERSDIDFEACRVHDSGDGLWLIMPPGTTKARLLHPLAYEFAARLHARNQRAGSRTQVRVRLALHAGEIRFGDEGEPFGRPLEVTARMLDAPPLRSALDSSPAASLAVMLSQHFYDETVPHGDPGIMPESFRRVSLTVKEYTADAWLYLPQSGLPQSEPQNKTRATPTPATPAPQPEDAGPGQQNDSSLSTSASTQNNRASDNATLYASQNGSITINGKP